MEMVTGEVVYETQEPRDFGYGPRVNIAVRPDDPDVPHVSDDGLIRVWASVGKEDANHLETLRSGDEVQLVWQTRGEKGWYSIVMPSKKTKPKTKVKEEAVPETDLFAEADEENAGDGEVTPRRIYIPLNVDQLIVYTEVAKQNIDLLLHVYRLTAQAVDETGIDIDQEVTWKMAVTAFINTQKEYRRDMVLLDTEPPF